MYRVITFVRDYRESDNTASNRIKYIQITQFRTLKIYTRHCGSAESERDWSVFSEVSLFCLCRAPRINFLFSLSKFFCLLFHVFKKLVHQSKDGVHTFVEVSRRQPKFYVAQKMIVFRLFLDFVKLQDVLQSSLHKS